jgi:hypothetical protein
MKRRMSKRRMSKRRMSRRRMSKRGMRGGLTCYNEKGWPDRNGYYGSNGKIDDDCPIKDNDSGSSYSESASWGERRGY